MKTKSYITPQKKRVGWEVPGPWQIDLKTGEYQAITVQCLGSSLASSIFRMDSPSG